MPIFVHETVESGKLVIGMLHKYGTDTTFSILKVGIDGTKYWYNMISDCK